MKPTGSPFPFEAATTVVALVVLLLPSLAMGQASPHVERNPVGSLINQDYFTADLYPEVKQQLSLVNHNHVNERVWNSYFDHMYEGPLADCKFALVYFPNHPRALYLLGELAKVTNQPAMPIEYFERALQLYPQHAYTHAQYGRFLIETGALNAGIAELREALRLDPGLLQAQLWMAEAQPQSGAAKPDSSGSAAEHQGAKRNK